ncbi:hypothetical protein SLA2020_347350 [Shorea laevis]
MGVSLSCPLGDIDDLDSHFQALLVKSISLRDEEMRKALRSVSFNGRDSERTVMASFGSGKMMDERSQSFNGRELETMFSFKTPRADMENPVFLRPVTFENTVGTNMHRSSKRNFHSESSEPDNRIYQAALRLQKVYKSFRTRRQLADCAVLVEQKWWKLLDFAELKRSSISFFDIEKPETALSRWSRARTRAAKVGKGLSKDEKARKLALQHWLEAIDPRHRYGHNLQFYYANWLHCESKQPFFYWLDIGEGKESNLERCPRSKLQQQCIKYLGPKERQSYEVVIENGKFVHKKYGKLLDTREGPKGTKWIFVLSTSKTLYVGQKKKGTFQHSSFLAGGATLSAGRLVVEDGILQAVWPHSGHYLPTEENFQEFMSFLLEQNVDLTNVKKSPSEDDEQIIIRKVSSLQRNQQEAVVSQEVEATCFENAAEEKIDSRKQDTDAAGNANQHMSRLSRGLFSKISKLHIPEKHEVIDIFKESSLPPSCCGEHPPSWHGERPEAYSDEGYETAEEILSEEEFMFPKANLSDDEEEDEKPVPKEKIVKRIDSHKGMKSYQLAQRLSSKWSTGAGPRISCMRDYPSELQLRVLEQANLSPRERTSCPSPQTTTRFSPKFPTRAPLNRRSGATKSPPCSDS